MEDAKKFVRRTIGFTLSITVVWMVLWGTVPAWKPLFSGLALGSAVSVYFAVSLARQAEAAALAGMRGGGRRPVMPFLSRIAAIALAVLIADKLAYPNVYAMIFALFTYQIVIFVDMYMHRGQGKIPNRKG